MNPIVNDSAYASKAFASWRSAAPMSGSVRRFDGRIVAPTTGQIAKIMALLDSDGEVFIHLERGADRTGAVIACNRIAHDGWRNQQALQEAKPFGMGPLQIGLKHYVMAFQSVPAVIVPWR